MIERLHFVGFQFLSDIGIHGMSVLMSQKWLSVDSIGFIDPLEIAAWNGYIAILKSSHVRLSTADDCLIWNLSKTGLSILLKRDMLNLFIEKWNQPGGGRSFGR